jgi:hypothetical protein
LLVLTIHSITPRTRALIARRGRWSTEARAFIIELLSESGRRPDSIATAKLSALSESTLLAHMMPPALHRLIAAPFAMRACLETAFSAAHFWPGRTQPSRSIGMKSSSIRLRSARSAPPLESRSERPAVKPLISPAALARTISPWSARSARLVLWLGALIFFSWSRRLHLVPPGLIGLSLSKPRSLRSALRRRLIARLQRRLILRKRRADTCHAENRNCEYP